MKHFTQILALVLHETEFCTKLKDVITPDVDYFTPIHYAAEKGHKDIVEWLAKFTDEPNARSKGSDISCNYEYTPMHLASENGHLEVVKVLVECTNNPNPKTRTGVTPLYVAAQNGHKNIVKYLMELVPFPNDKTKFNQTPEWIAAYCGYPGIAALLGNQWSYDFDLNDSFIFKIFSGHDSIDSFMDLSETCVFSVLKQEEKNNPTEKIVQVNLWKQCIHKISSLVINTFKMIIERTIVSIPRVEENYRSMKIYPKYFNFENSKDICITKLSYGAISNYIKKVKNLPDDQYIFQVVKIKMIGEPPSQISLFDSEYTNIGLLDTSSCSLGNFNVWSRSMPEKLLLVLARF